MTKEELKALFANGHLVVASDMASLIDSLKGEQSAVSDPSASGNSVTFISNIQQDAEGVITAQKKSVNFSGYQTTAGMAGYQNYDVQVVDVIETDDSRNPVTVNVEHKKGHYPTVRIIDGDGNELRPTSTLVNPFTVTHVNTTRLQIVLDGSLNVNNARYWYVLD